MNTAKAIQIARKLLFDTGRMELKSMQMVEKFKMDEQGKQWADAYNVLANIPVED